MDIESRLKEIEKQQELIIEAINKLSEHRDKTIKAIHNLWSELDTKMDKPPLHF